MEMRLFLKMICNSFVPNYNMYVFQGADIKGHPSVIYFMDGVYMCIRCSLHTPHGLFA